MTIYDKGLIRAIKAAYKDGGYDVAMTEEGLLIQGECWGVEISRDAVPNSVKSLIVLHSGAMPGMNKAIHVAKSECGDIILETTVSTMDSLSKQFTTTGGRTIKPTTLTFGGNRVWQTTDSLEIRLIDPNDQQILTGESWDAHLVTRHIYGRNWFGQMYIMCQPVVPEDKPLLSHLSEMQWIPVELE